MITGRDIRAGLKGQSSRSSVTESTFWKSFAQRAGAGAPAREAPGWYWLLHNGTVRWGLGSLAGVAAALAIFLAGSPKVQAQVGVVRNLDIYGAYDSVMILQETVGGGAFVWIEGI